MTTAEEEEWLPVAGFDEGYEISSHGRLRSWKSGVARVLSPAPDRGGYLTACIRRSGRTVNMKISREVLKAFVGPPPAGKNDACHNDGDRTNNHVDNLRWDSRQGNVADKKVHGTLIRGEQLQQAKLTETQVHSIDAALRQGATQASIGRAMGLPTKRIHQIATGRSWAWLTGREPYERAAA